MPKITKTNQNKYKDENEKTRNKITKTFKLKTRQENLKKYIYKYINIKKTSAVNWLITSKIKVFVYILCVYCVYFFIDTHTHMHVYI